MVDLTTGVGASIVELTAGGGTIIDLTGGGTSASAFDGNPLKSSNKSNYSTPRRL